MADQLAVYACEKCGNMVQVLRGCSGTLTCCNQAMSQQVENTVDAAREKHVPAVEQNGNQLKVSVGSVAHPMEDKHYIEWIEVSVGGKVQTAFLAPGTEPVATFEVGDGDISVRAYCNLHGLWRS